MRYGFFRGIWELSGYSLKRYFETIEEFFSKCFQIIKNSTENPFLRMIYCKFVHILAEKADHITDYEIQKLVELYSSWGMDKNTLIQITEVLKEIRAKWKK